VDDSAVRQNDRDLAFGRPSAPAQRGRRFRGLLSQARFVTGYRSDVECEAQSHEAQPWAVFSHYSAERFTWTNGRKMDDAAIIYSVLRSVTYRGQVRLPEYDSASQVHHTSERVRKLTETSAAIKLSSS
jgi:hypothetical protein